MCPFSNQNSVKFLLSQSVDRNVEKVSLYLHCYFEMLSNSYSVHGYRNFIFGSYSKRHDKKLAMLITGFMQKYSSSQHQQSFIEIENICQHV